MTSSAEPPHSENGDQNWECLPTTSRCVDRIAFSPDGKLIASCNDDSLEHIKLWEVESGKQLFDMNNRLYASDFTLPVSSGEKVYYLFDFYYSRFKSFFFSCNPKDLTCWGIVRDQAVGKVVYVKSIDSSNKNHPWEPVAVSPDLQLTASAYTSTSAITLWETFTGIDKHTFYLNEEVREISGIYVNQFSPNGKIFASLFSFKDYSSSGKEKIKLWQVETGKELCSTSLLQDAYATSSWGRILAFSSDSRILASNSGDSSNRVIVLLETATGVELCRFQGFGKKNSDGLDKVTSLAFSPDNQLLASGDSTGVITLWRLSKGWLRPLKARKIRTLISCESCEPVKTLAFSPDGELLASGLGDNNSGITLWNVKSGEKHQTFSGHLVEANKISTADSINRDNLAVSPDGKIIAYFDIAHRMIKLWDTQNSAFLGRFEICDVVSKIVFSQNSKFIIGVQNKYSLDQTSQNIIIWELATGRKVESIDYLSQGHWGSRTVNQYGDLLAIIDPVTLSLKVLEVRTGQTLCTIRGGYQCVLQIIFSPDKRLLATQYSMSEFAIWEITTGRFIRTIHTDNIENNTYLPYIEDDTDVPCPGSVLFSPDGEILAIAATQNITLWQVSSGEKIHTIDRVHRAWGRCMAFSPSGQTLAFTITDEALLRLWNLETGNETCFIDQSVYQIETLDFSLNGQVLVSSYSNGTIKVWQQNKVLV